MSSLLVPWLRDATVSFLCSNKKNTTEREGKLVQVLSKVEATTSSFVVHDTQFHLAACFTDRAIGRYIKSGRELGQLVHGRAIVSLDEWNFVIMNEKQIVLMVDKFRHVVDGSNCIYEVTEYLMKSGTVQAALESHLGTAKLPMQVVEQDEENAYVGGETLEPGDWNCLESFYATQTQVPMTPNKKTANISAHTTPNNETNARYGKSEKLDSEEEYEIPPQQWDLIVEEMVGAGLTSSPYKMSPKKTLPTYPTSPIQNLPGNPVKSASTPIKSPFKSANTAFKQIPTKATHSPLLERFEKVANVLLNMRPVYSSSSPATERSSPIKSSPPKRTTTLSPLKTTTQQSSLPRKSDEEKPIPRYEVNMTARRVLFEEDGQQPQQQPRKSATPKRLRLYTDW